MARRADSAHDSGATVLEYGAVLVLVAALVAGLFAAGVVGKATTTTSTAICQIFGGKCSTAPAGSGSRNGVASPQPGTGPAAAPGAQKKSSGKGWCSSNWLTTGLCILGAPVVNAGKAVAGTAQGVWDTVTGLWDGVTFVGCLAHICSQKGFESNWGALKNLVTHPGKALPAIWGDMTKHCHKWETQAVSRCVTDFVGSIFGAKGLNKLKELGVLNKLKDAAKGAQDAGDAGKGAGAAKAAARIALLARIQKLVDQVGDPTQPFIVGGRRVRELPYRPPPGAIAATVDHPLDLATLQPTRYLWIVDGKGVVRLAPETSPNYAAYYGNRDIIKHGDLAAAEGAPVDQPAPGYGVQRPSARAGGELTPEYVNGRPTGRWIMDLKSSYSFPNTRADHVALSGANLQAVKDLLHEMGTDTSKIDLANPVY